jgi:EAL domain-containing protein (putative c-di-GMP-specific phosphodiesterase class I)
VSADELLSRADAAMYEAKRSGKGRYRVFDEAAFRAVGERKRLETELRGALQAGQLRLHYQPIIDLRNGATYAVEALLRWEHPDGRLRAADEFIDVAEQAGLLPDIGIWVVAESCRQTAAWDSVLGTKAPYWMFLNLSAAELSQPRLHDHLADTARAWGVEPRRLVLEVTETGMLDAARSAETLAALKRIGCRLAIDDFGTGYSSLSRLVQLPASVLKVDRSFLRDLHGDQQSIAVIAAVLTLAHNLRKTVIAEGVEDAASLATLKTLGCDYAQGYHLGTPQDPDELTAHLAEQPDAPAMDSLLS